MIKLTVIVNKINEEKISNFVCFVEFNFSIYTQNHGISCENIFSRRLSFFKVYLSSRYIFMKHSMKNGIVQLMSNKKNIPYRKLKS